MMIPPKSIFLKTYLFCGAGCLIAGEERMDCFVAEPVIGRAFARPVGSSQLCEFTNSLIE
jgi:hypothetical protein